jgi:phosphatidylglycerophosphate synthase
MCAHDGPSGYARALLTAASLYYMSTSPKYSTLMYGLSALLDAADGHAARALGQTSKFGAVLDMVVDRSVVPLQIPHFLELTGSTDVLPHASFAILR